MRNGVFLPAGDNGRMEKLMGSTPFSQKRKHYHLTKYLLNSTRCYHPRVDGRSAASVFSRTDVSPKLGSFRPFGCPTYVLSNELATGKNIPKWFKRARVGLYLGQSPQHAGSVALVLNISTGLVSPQFHVAFDDLFETVGTKEDAYEIGWLSATHFSEKSSGAKGSRGRTKPVVVDSLSQEIFPLPQGRCTSGRPG